MCGAVASRPRGWPAVSLNRPPRTPEALKLPCRCIYSCSFTYYVPNASGVNGPALRIEDAGRSSVQDRRAAQVPCEGYDLGGVSGWTVRLSRETDAVPVRATRMQGVPAYR